MNNAKRRYSEQNNKPIKSSDLNEKERQQNKEMWIKHERPFWSDRINCVWHCDTDLQSKWWFILTSQCVGAILAKWFLDRVRISWRPAPEPTKDGQFSRLLDRLAGKAGYSSLILWVVSHIYIQCLSYIKLCQSYIILFVVVSHPNKITNTNDLATSECFR